MTGTLSEDQQRAEAAAHGRNLGPAEQGITDPGQCRGPRRDQGQPQPQGQPGDQRQQAQGNQIGRGHHRADMQPADREQMRQPRIAHRFFISLGNRAAIPAGKGRRDGPRRTFDPVANIGRKPTLYAGDHPLVRRSPNERQRADHGSGGRQPLEPRRSRKVIAPGQHRARWRHQPGAQAHHRGDRSGALGWHHRRHAHRGSH